MSEPAPQPQQPQPLRPWRWRDWFSASARRDAIELFLLPGLAAILPWRLAFAVLRWLAFHWRYPYRPTVEAAWQQALARGQVQPEQQHVWQAERRLVTLVDHADMYLSLTRNPRRYMAHWLEASGQWTPPGQAAVLVTFHWGAGMWGLHHARAAGLQPVALIEALNPSHFPGRPLLYHYARWRIQQVRKALGQAPVDISQSLRPILQALRAQQQVLVVADVPADRAGSSISVEFAGQRTQVPRALLKLMAQQRIPVCYYITGIDLLTGQRFVRMQPLGAFDDAEALAAALFARLDGLMAEKNAAWHLWDQAPRFWGNP
ncbi:hypothetical protein EBQ26_12215 [Allofranklinella schreckenbergeri]|uniref:Uncharacterized protein n=1 Tax=Allofranklinella schreckenbergeri TaxID=1076744 RepID=A0A3M6PTW2_9BURK|nr:hypothetical protein [Allofranklinella schreckenbergeri]RMW94617.1 hypothetical protein EBQ26_12215 [Allofranklinella schreckenbergeri]